jgi:molybdenum cofactor biosynthesis enzyme MoaA
VSAGGDVRPCCNFHPIGRLGTGEVGPDALRESQAFASLRASLLSGDLEGPCQVCHIRRTVPTSELRKHLDEAMATAGAPGTPDLAPLPITEIRVDINEKCNLRCDYCEVSSPTYAGVEMDRATFEHVLPLLAQAPGAMVHVNGHGETTFHPQWVEWCREIVEAGHRPFIITNLAKAYSDEEIALLARFRMIQVSLDSDDSELMRSIRKRVSVQHVFDTIARIRAAGAPDPPYISASVGVYDPSIWTLEPFVRRLMTLQVRSITFWDLVEKSHQSLVRSLRQLDSREQARARAVLVRVRRMLDDAGVHHRFAGDFHGMVPGTPRFDAMVRPLRLFGRRVAHSQRLRRLWGG